MLEHENVRQQEAAFSSSRECQFWEGEKGGGRGGGVGGGGAQHTNDASFHLVVPPRPTCCSATAELLASMAAAAALPSSPATFTSLLHTTCNILYLANNVFQVNVSVKHVNTVDADQPMMD